MRQAPRLSERSLARTGNPPAISSRGPADGSASRTVSARPTTAPAAALPALTQQGAHEDDELRGGGEVSVSGLPAALRAAPGPCRAAVAAAPRHLRRGPVPRPQGDGAERGGLAAVQRSPTRAVPHGEASAPRTLLAVQRASGARGRKRGAAEGAPALPLGATVTAFLRPGKQARLFALLPCESLRPEKRRGPRRAVRRPMLLASRCPAPLSGKRGRGESQRRLTTRGGRPRKLWEPAPGPGALRSAPAAAPFRSPERRGAALRPRPARRSPSFCPRFRRRARPRAARGSPRPKRRGAAPAVHRESDLFVSSEARSARVSKEQTQLRTKRSPHQHLASGRRQPAAEIPPPP